MRNWSLPSVFEARTAVEFFESFIESNRPRRGFSQRNLAKRLSWPASYLTDLTRGRKALTVRRALEFSDFFKLDPFSRERLVYLAIESQSEKHRNVIHAIAARSAPKKLKSTNDESLLNARIALIEAVVRWKSGSITEKALLSLLLRYDYTSSEISASIKFLIERSMIDKRGQNLHARSRAFFESDDFENGIDARQLHLDCAEFFKRAMIEPIKPLFYNASFLFLEPQKIYQYHEKALALRNWLIAESDATGRLSMDKAALFQLDINLFPLCEHKVPYTKRGPSA